MKSEKVCLQDHHSGRDHGQADDGKNDQQNKEDTEGADRVLLLFNFVSHVVPFKWANEPRLDEARMNVHASAHTHETSTPTTSHGIEILRNHP